MEIIIPSGAVTNQKQDEPCNDLGDKISDVDVENEIPNIETVKYLISKVQKNWRVKSMMMK